MSIQTTLVVLSLTTLAAAGSAQTVPVKRPSAPQDLFSIGVDYANAAKSTTTGAGTFDSDGMVVKLRAGLGSGVFLAASFADINHKDATITGSSKDYSLGLGTRFAAGAGEIDLSYAYGKVDFAGTRHGQHTIRAAYDLGLGKGVDMGLAVVEFVNDKAVSANVTAPEVSVGYRFGQGLSARLAFSTENTLFGFAGGSSTVSVGLRYGF